MLAAISSRFATTRSSIAFTRSWYCSRYRDGNPSSSGILRRRSSWISSTFLREARTPSSIRVFPA